jgi:hypothetical protein
MTCELPAYSPANSLRTLCAISPYNPLPVSRQAGRLPALLAWSGVSCGRRPASFPGHTAAARPGCAVGVQHRARAIMASVMPPASFEGSAIATAVASADAARWTSLESEPISIGYAHTAAPLRTGLDIRSAPNASGEPLSQRPLPTPWIHSIGRQQRNSPDRRRAHQWPRQAECATCCAFAVGGLYARAALRLSLLRKTHTRRRTRARGPTVRRRPSSLPLAEVGRGQNRARRVASAPSKEISAKHFRLFFLQTPRSFARNCVLPLSFSANFLRGLFETPGCVWAGQFSHLQIGGALPGKEGRRRVSRDGAMI